MLNKKNINLNHLIKVREHTLHEAWRAMDRKGGLGVVKELRAAAVLNTHCYIPGKILQRFISFHRDNKCKKLEEM